MHPSSALRLACSHAFLASSSSTVLPLAHVLTTKLVLDSRGYGRPLAKAVFNCASSDVVLTCCETPCSVLVR